MRSFWSLGLCGLFAIVRAQTSDLPIPCCSVPTEQVPQSDRATWCSANLNTCRQLCGSTEQNQCDSNSLDFSCKCTNGTDISTSMARYQQTIPGLMCQVWFTACINATGSDASAQSACQSTRDASCGAESVGVGVGSSSISSLMTLRTSAASSRIGSASSPTVSSSTNSRTSGTSQATPPPNDPSESDPGTGSTGLSKGAIAGIVVGTVLAILLAVIVLWMCKRRRKQTRAGAVAIYDEKETVPPGSSVPSKPELHGDHIAELPQPDPPEMYASPSTHPAQLHGNDSGTRVELPTSEAKPELDASTPRTAEIPAPAYQAQNSSLHIPPTQGFSGTSPGPVPQSLEPEINHHNRLPETAIPQSLQPQTSQQAQSQQAALPSTQIPLWRATPEEISAWEEEERRIDAEIEEIRRVKELSDRKLAIQQKLREARGE